MPEEVDDPYVGNALKDLGKRIRQARMARGLSVRDMVINHNYHDAQWRRYEKGGSLTVPSLLRISRSLRTSLAVLLDGVGEFSTSQVDLLKGTSAASKNASNRKSKVKDQLPSGLTSPK